MGGGGEGGKEGGKREVYRKEGGREVGGRVRGRQVISVLSVLSFQLYSLSLHSMAKSAHELTPSTNQREDDAGVGGIAS